MALRLIYLRVRAFLRDAAIILLVTVVFAEIALRVYHAVEPTFIFPDTEYKRYLGRPGALEYDFKLNSLGFKDTEFKREKPPGGYRILALGDSFAWGVVPYPDNYLTLLEKFLEAKQPGVEVLNMGVPGIDPEDYLAVLVNEGLAFDPDAVLLSFFIGNDFEPKLLRSKFIYPYSYLATYVRAVYKMLPHPILDGELRKYDDGRPLFSEQYFLALEVKRSEIYQPKGRKKLYAALDRVMELIGRIRSICEQRKMKLLVVLIPDELQVSADLQRQVATVARVNPDHLDLPNRLLSARLRQASIEYLDLLPLMREQGRKQVLYKPRDTHWNIAGNQLAADAIAEAISGWLSRE